MDVLTDRFLVDPGRFTGPVLVTGAGGCLGAWTMAVLSRSGVECIGFDLSSDRKRPGLLMGDSAADALDWETGDITQFEPLLAIARKYDIKAIIHYAGLQVPFCKADPALGARVNVEGTINVLQAARETGIRRLVLASSVASLAFPPGSSWSETLYGAYKQANEHTAFVYWADWRVPSVCIRPSIVYGVARDQGVSSKSTLAIQAAVLNMEYQIPFTGPMSWLYAGEAAAAFIAAVSQDGDGAHCFDLNGTCATVQYGVDILKSLAPDAKIACDGPQIPFPVDQDDGPLRSHVPDYPSVTVADGIEATHRAFESLRKKGRLPALPE